MDITKYPAISNSIPPKTSLLTP